MSTSLKVAAAPAAHPVGPAYAVVADEMPLFRQGVLAVLRQALPGFRIQEAASVGELLALTRQQAPALLVVAAALVGRLPEPATLLATLRARQPQTTLLVFTDLAVPASPALLSLVRPYPHGLLPRTAPPETVYETICTLRPAAGLPAPATPPPARSWALNRFSGRQLQVLQLVAQDLSNEDIAEQLCTSVRTVEYHRSQLLQKTGTRSTLGLVLLAQRVGLLTVSPLADWRPAA